MMLRKENDVIVNNDFIMMNIFVMNNKIGFRTIINGLNINGIPKNRKLMSYNIDDKITQTNNIDNIDMFIMIFAYHYK